LEHLKNPNLFLKEASRILKKRGDLLIITPNILSYNGFIVAIVSRISHRLKEKIYRLLTNSNKKLWKTYYKCNYPTKIDKICKFFGFKKKIMILIVSIDYFFNFPFGFFFYKIKSRILNLEFLRNLRESIFAVYEKL